MKENINKNISNNSNVDLNNNNINIYKECPYCNIILNSLEYNDHILCHELDKEENGQLNNINNYQIGNSNSNNNNNEDDRSDTEDKDFGSHIHNFFGKIADKAKSIISPIKDNKGKIKNHLEKIPNFFKDLFDIKDENKKENKHQNIQNNSNNNNRNSNNNNRIINNIRNSNNRNSLNNRNSYLNQRLSNRIDSLFNRNNILRIRNYPRYNYNRYRRRLNHDNDNIDNLLLFEHDDNNNNFKNNLFKEEDAKEILRYIPSSIVKEIKQPNDNNYRCTICLSEFQIGEKESTLPCLHMYHTNCIEKWIIRDRSCPVCKYDISLDSILAKNIVEDNNNN